MFVYSVRASTVRFFAVIVLTLLVLVGAIALGNTGAVAAYADGSVSFSGIKTNEDRLEFISQFGIQVAGEAKEEKVFTVPENFDRIIAGYNEIQKEQGLDLAKYKNKKVTRYTYETMGYEDYEGPVSINLIVYRNKIIACDISSQAPDGFVLPLVKTAVK